MMKIEGSASGSESGSGSISQRHGSADPDPNQNVMDPQHCHQESKLAAEFVFNNPNISGTCGCGESFSM
jgi:hypothetical protein